MGVNREVVGIRADGAEVPLQVNLAGICFRGEDMVLASVIDISSRKELERNLLDARDAAIALGDARSRLIAHVSHEIRTPLTSIIGLTSMLLDTDLAEEQREMVATTALASDRLLQLVNEILDFARGDAGHAVLREVDFSPAELLAEVSRIVRPAARTKDVEVGTSVGTGTPAVVHGDRDKLRTVLSTSPGTR